MNRRERWNWNGGRLRSWNGISIEHVEQCFLRGIQLWIEYDPQPPFDSGRPERAPAGVRDRMRERVLKRRADALASLHAGTR